MTDGNLTPLDAAYYLTHTIPQPTMPRYQVKPREQQYVCSICREDCTDYLPRIYHNSMFVKDQWYVNNSNGHAFCRSCFSTMCATLCTLIRKNPEPFKYSNLLNHVHPHVETLNTKELFSSCQVYKATLGEDYTISYFDWALSIMAYNWEKLRP